MFENLIHDSLIAFPILGWALLAILILLVQILGQQVWVSFVATIGGLVVLFVYSLLSFQAGFSQEIFRGAAVIDNISQAFNLVGIGVALASVLTMLPGLSDTRSFMRTSYEQFPEFLVCLLFSGFGLGVLASANDLSSLFLGLETLSIGLYCLCGFFRRELSSTESAFKYLMIGAFSTAIFLYGVAFLYGATGATHFNEIALAAKAGMSPILSLGILFLMAGFAFKLALVPFHLYTADVYEGAPTPVTGYLATIVKVGLLAAAFRLFGSVLATYYDYWSAFWIDLCVLSILVGNFAALQQKTIKKLLAFSSISHAGFMGLAFVAGGPAVRVNFPLLAYVMVYSAMTIGVFATLTHLENREKAFFVEDLRGLAQKRFGWATTLGIFMLSLAGLPPFAGFMIKFWVLQALIQNHFVFPAIAAIVGSLIGAGYYLRILMLMFMHEESGPLEIWVFSRDRFFAIRGVVFVTVAITLLGGLRPQFYADWILRLLALK